ncbi:MAG: glutamine--tRNA ligase/YqeY domain fusion protein [candidate division KSB1 bacterium]|nr:glutamine--tRNA ligase/YqeY domain fusion protein [candidate division KSB1 bacterium]MDZ7274972.1 glutamine--tRNA ligase/YqeY domain fusion protein [candidate division KSB1 bacterium]MDZ7286577.1 glutamine--tRNA ligase/YqeY domain fusion protein [candidate division KSB1 bacterium]MDZ7299259.1 glutamine--tRNA ligase/YqeY domain fusion protein [candidate division KSB1 bacterium]MDZ7306081.1 glutamine--tRNA ligase/YqeY domain fusion protein [candidate division KSB1 bacterium]
MPSSESTPVASNFIRELIREDLRTNRFGGQVITRFPPEPNGYLHIGHAKAICIDFGMAKEFGGRCHLRFDDTNPTKEEQEYVDAITADVRWLGFDWGEHLYFASDYFEQLYDYAVQLIKAGKAYVDDLSTEEIRAYRGTLTEPGRNSPWRDRSVEENLDLFARMRAGEFPDGAKVLRAKIDMASPNLNLRDPVMYRIRHATHHRTGDKWCIYPMYDWAHGQSDSIEGITHSICTLEYEDHRPLYDWFLDALGIHHPQQIEFARLNLTYTVMSKRKLLQLVEQGHVSGWDDPRLPTLAGLRRRGFPPEAIRDFCERIGVAKSNSVVDVGLLEHCVREYLNRHAPRVMAVLRPLRVVITNYPEGRVEEMEAINNPEDPAAGTRRVPFTRVLYIERDDFREDPPRKFFRLAPGREVRLRYAYFITCTEVVKDPATGEIIELRCTYDPATRGGDSPDGRKVKGTIHWVSAAHARKVEVRLYDRLFLKENPDDNKDFLAQLNPNSLEVLKDCLVEPGLAQAAPGSRFQFERLGYFCVDTVDSRPGQPVFNRIVPLKDSWSKIEKAGNAD